MSDRQTQTETETDEPISYHSADGETVDRGDLQEGQTVALRISWYSWDESKPVTFTVVRNDFCSLKLEGSDGHTYRIYDDSSHVECTTDEKQGYDRGHIAARPKVLPEPTPTPSAETPVAAPEGAYGRPTGDAPSHTAKSGDARAPGDVFSVPPAGGDVDRGDGLRSDGGRDTYGRSADAERERGRRAAQSARGDALEYRDETPDRPDETVERDAHWFDCPDCGRWFAAHAHGHTVAGVWGVSCPFCDTTYDPADIPSKPIESPE
jgi:hypothetical protein